MSSARAFFTGDEYEVLEAACEDLIPAHGDHPGARALGVADYIDGLLGAFTFDPPRIWAGGPFSGRFGGDGRFTRFTALSRLEELAWRTRIEGSRGIPEREFNGPVEGWQESYRRGIAELGVDFPGVPPDERAARHEAAGEFKALLYQHACEGAYAAPEYGGNRDGAGWRAVRFPGDVQPRGYTDTEVSSPD